jgi:hypothetical protein
VVELTDVSEKCVASMLRVKPFKKDPECWVTKLHRNDSNNLPVDMASSFYQHIGLKFEEETSKMLHLEHGFIWCCNLDASGNRSEIPGKF